MTKQTDVQTIRNDFLDLELTTPGAGYTTCSASNASPTVLEVDMEEYARVWNSHSGQWSRCLHLTEDEIRKDRESRRNNKLKNWDRDIKKAKVFDGISGIELIEIIVKQNKRSKRFKAALKDLCALL